MYGKDPYWVLRDPAAGKTEELLSYRTHGQVTLALEDC